MTGIKLKWKKWRLGALKHLLNEGTPKTAEELLNEVRQKDGRKYTTAPTTNQLANTLHRDKRFVYRVCTVTGTG